MQYIRKYNLFRESNEYEDLILRKGTILYHGSIENINGGFRVGGDGVFWTTENEKIAKSYIPSSYSTMLTSSSSIYKPSNVQMIQNLQKLIDIDYDYSSVTFDNVGYATSFKYPTILNDLYNNESKIYKKISVLSKQIDTYKSEYKKIEKSNDDTAIDDIIEKWENAENNYNKLLASLHENSFDTKAKQLVNERMRRIMNYEPDSCSGVDCNWRVKAKLNNIPMKGDEYIIGKLYKLELLDDIKVYDLTVGGSVEGDLTDLDYNKITLFRNVVKSGYDAIKINDFAQMSEDGNVNHTSIGFFMNTISKLKVVEIKDAKHVGRL